MMKCDVFSGYSGTVLACHGVTACRRAHADGWCAPAHHAAHTLRQCWIAYASETPPSPTSEANEWIASGNVAAAAGVAPFGEVRSHPPATSPARSGAARVAGYASSER
jgi:hypothetical protein